MAFPKKEQRFDRGTYVLVIAVNGEQRREPKTGPGKIRKAANFTKALAKHVGNGSKKATLEVIQKRYEICSNCPDNLFIQLEPKRVFRSLREIEGVGTCTHKKCGCFIHPTETFPNKLGWESNRCPRQHWGAV